MVSNLFLTLFVSTKPSKPTVVNSLHKVDDWLTHVAEVQCLYVTERFDGRKTAFSGFIGLPGTKKPFKREKDRV